MSSLLAIKTQQDDFEVQFEVLSPVIGSTVTNPYQLEIAKKLEKIEGIANWKEYSFSIDCAQDQMKFKDMLQIRFIEELTEASAAEEYEHFWEEITDALNFFLSILNPFLLA